ncbi:MAG: tRNA adenosine(34) deaminase TadA [Gammaproteobacteria bacterium]|nr:MAG: tRNA adenosine(34) deaminase TadA [Gammaproteobacteria bacterium]
MLMSDLEWMRRAITLAQKAEQQGEVPVGALLVREGVCVGEGWNQPILRHDPSAHAEINALRDAGQATENYRLIDTVLYVTLEPCVMCMGAIANARVRRLVFGASDPARGAAGSILSLSNASFLNHHIETEGGLLAEECSELLRSFFARRRRK